MPFRVTPLEKLNDAISTAAAAVAEREQVRVAVTRRKAELSRRNARVRDRKAQLRQEERAFTRFDRLTLPSLIHGVLGTRDQKRQEEYEQWQRARQALLHAMSERDQLVEEVQRLQKRAAELARAHEWLERALRRKELWLRRYDVHTQGRLRQLDQGERALKISISKINLALDANRKAQENIQLTPRSVIVNQLRCLEEARRQRMARLKGIFQEKRRLLFDGAANVAPLRQRPSAI